MGKIRDHAQRPEFASWRSYFDFEQRVRNSRRYVWDIEVRTFLETVRGTLDDRDYTLREGTTLWRVQAGVDWIVNDDGMEERMGFLRDRMNPDARYVGEGRANTAGIPVLYLASTEQTAISEVRPWTGSNVSVAQYRIVRDLRAIDLTPGFGKSSLDGLTFSHLMGEKDPDSEIKEKAVWTEIDNAFSRHVEISANLADYVPTQILSELFRDSGYDAIIYRSNFGEEGYNIAVFSPNDAVMSRFVTKSNDSSCPSAYSSRPHSSSLREIRSTGISDAL